MKNFINRPIPRLLRYELLLKNVLDETPEGHEDKDTIPQVLEVIKALGKETEPGVVSAKQKVEVWRYNSNLVFKQGEAIVSQLTPPGNAGLTKPFQDMDLLNENRSLIHAGRLLRQPDTGFEWNSWTELFVLLFDNYRAFQKTHVEVHVVLILRYSRHDEAERAGWCNQVPCLQTSKHAIQSEDIIALLTPPTANSARFAYACELHRPADSAE